MFSERELAILKVIGRKKVTFVVICEELFHGATRKPFDAEISVANTIRRIIKKCEYHKLDWTLNKDKLGGKLIISKGKI